MITTISPQSSDMSTVDALWVLIQSQKKRVRKILTERLVAEQNKTKDKKQWLRKVLPVHLMNYILTMFTTMHVISLICYHSKL